jgi:hypothetical protein
MQRLGVHGAVISTLDYIPAPALATEAVLPQEAGKLERAALILGETAREAGGLGLDFRYALPQPDVSGRVCRENIGRSLYAAADGGLSPCVYVNVPAETAASARRVFGNVCVQDPISIWESEDFRSFRDRLAGGQPDGLCRACPKRFMAG